MDATEAIDPTELMDRIEPAEPIERIEPDEPIERIEPDEPSDFIDPVEPTEAQLASTAVTLVAVANRRAPMQVPRETPMTTRPGMPVRRIAKRTALRPGRCRSRPVVRGLLIRRDSGVAGDAEVVIVRSWHIASALACPR
jgi:hypothetical protein